MSPTFPGFLYVSSDLVSFVAPLDTMLALDMGQDDGDRFRCYRRLDVTWFTWLAYKMAKLKHLDEGGQVDPATFATMRTAWSVVVDAAVACFGLVVVDAAAITPPHANYDPPKVRKGTELGLARSTARPSSPNPSGAPARTGERVLLTPAQRAA